MRPGLGVGHASGKAILLGEHAVVYGAPAIAAGLREGARATARRLPAGEESRLELGGRRFSAARPGGAGGDVERAFGALLGELGALGDAGVEVQAESDLPAGGGLGSSAALGVAVARALVDLAGGGGAPDLSGGPVLAAASAWERIFHGNPSGVDTTAALQGGVFLFVRGEGARALEPGAELTLCVGATGSPSSTRAMVEGVARRRARDPAGVDGAIAAIAALSRSAAVALEAGDLAAFGAAMDRNQVLLAGLGVSTPAIDRMCALAKGAGALGAKLTGAGGGGSVVALVPAPAARTVLEAWRCAGFHGFASRIAASAGDAAGVDDRPGSRVGS